MRIFGRDKLTKEEMAKNMSQMQWMTPFEIRNVCNEVRSKTGRKNVDPSIGFLYVALEELEEEGIAESRNEENLTEYDLQWQNNKSLADPKLKAEVLKKRQGRQRRLFKLKIGGIRKKVSETFKEEQLGFSVA